MKRNTRHLAAGTLAAAMLVATTAHAATPANSNSAAPAARLLQNRSTMPLSRAQAPVAGFDRFIVKYRDGSAARRNTMALTDLTNAALRSAGIAGSMVSANGARATLSIKHVRTTAVGADLVHASRRLSASESNAFLKQLRSDPAVQYAQPDYMKQRLDTVPDDTYFGQLQWDYTDPTGGIKATTAWDITKGEGVVVAVLDTGHADHPDLDGNLVPGYDFISAYGQTTEEGLWPDVAGDGDGRDADAHDPGDWTDASMSAWCPRVSNSSWHGTHVAGTVAAVGNNASGIAGVAYHAKVQPVRVLGHCGGLTSDIADAIIWASGGEVPGVPMNENPAEVLNLSLGGSGSCSDDPMTQEAIDGAISRGVTVVVAAGNEGDNAANHSPASCKGVITVGATGIDGGKSWFSNYGASVTLSAPGGNATSGSDPDDRWIWSTGDVGATIPEGPGLIGMIGTSQASPHVAGVVALMQSAAVAAGKPALSPAQIKNILRGTARSFPIAPPMSTPMGAGIVDAAAATLAATQDVGDEQAEVLSNRVPMPGQTGAAGDELLYSIEVPAGTRSLNLRSYGGTGNVSLYVAYDYIPTAALHDRKSARPGNSEAVVITNPAAGTYYLRVVGEQAFSNVSVMGLY